MSLFKFAPFLLLASTCFANNGYYYSAPPYAPPQQQPQQQYSPYEGYYVAQQQQAPWHPNDQQQMVNSPAGMIEEGTPVKDVTPSAGPRVNEGVDIFLTADFVYWTGRMDGLSYATSGSSSVLGAPITGRGSVKYPDFSFDPGFKVGLGVSMNHDGWDMYAQYTWFHTGDNKDSTSQNFATSTLAPVWDIAGGFPLVGDTLASARTKWKLRQNIIDLELGRNFFISKYLKLRPFFGLKGNWYDQDYTVRYSTTNDGVNFTNFRMNQDNDFWGIGVRGGLNTAWQFNSHIGIVGNLALSGLWGQFNVERRDRQQVGAAAEQTFLYTQNDFHSIKPVLELFLGLRAETWFSDNRYHVALDAGWEQQIWWDQNQLIRIRAGSSSQGDLVFHGLTIKLRLDF